MLKGGANGTLARAGTCTCTAVSDTDDGSAVEITTRLTRSTTHSDNRKKGSCWLCRKNRNEPVFLPSKDNDLLEVLEAAASPDLAGEHKDCCLLLLADMLGGPTTLPRDDWPKTAFARNYGHHKSCWTKRRGQWAGTVRRPVGRPVAALTEEELGAATAAVASLFGPTLSVVPWAECAAHLAKNLFLDRPEFQQRGWRQQLGVHMAAAGDFALVRADPDRLKSSCYVAKMSALGRAASSIHRAEVERDQAGDVAALVSAAKRVEMTLPSMVRRVALQVRAEIANRSVVKGPKTYVTSTGISPVKMSESITSQTLVELLYSVCGT